MVEKQPFRVTAAADGSVRIAGRFPREGETVRLTEKEALWEVRRGLVEPIAAAVVTAKGSASVRAPSEPADALDHDGDGRKGSSLPRAPRRKA
jgi:hypothetical protein